VAGGPAGTNAGRPGRYRRTSHHTASAGSPIASTHGNAEKARRLVVLGHRGLRPEQRQRDGGQRRQVGQAALLRLQRGQVGLARRHLFLQHHQVVERLRLGQQPAAAVHPGLLHGDPGVQVDGLLGDVLGADLALLLGAAELLGELVDEGGELGGRHPQLHRRGVRAAAAAAAVVPADVATGRLDDPARLARRGVDVLHAYRKGAAVNDRALVDAEIRRPRRGVLAPGLVAGRGGRLRLGHVRDTGPGGGGLIGLAVATATTNEQSHDQSGTH
jgi:hypothetical protein